MDLNHRQQKRAKALALQLYNAGDWFPCHCGDPGCIVKRTRKTVADKIITKQWRTLKLTNDIVRHALSMVSIIND
jgi:hypothetical protein